MKNRFTSVTIVRAMALLLSGFLLSCTNELNEVYEPSSLEEEVESTSPYHIPLNDALNNLEKTMEVMGVTTTRSQYNRAKWKIERIPMSQFRPETRATDEGMSEAIYVVNFDNNEGYAIVSADTRLPDDVIAVTNSGMVEFEPNPMDDPLDSLTLEDLYVAADNDYLLGGGEGEDFIEDLVTNYIIGWTDSLRGNEDEFGDPITPPGGLIVPGQGDDDDDGSGGIPGLVVRYDTIVPPVTAKLQTKWHQRDPYNRYCPNRYYHRVLGMRFGSIREYDFDPRAEWEDKYLDSMDLAAGCVSIAVGQILAYHKYPEVSVIVGEDNAMSWDSLLICNLDNSTDARYEDYIAKLVHSIGVGCDMDYGFWKDQSYATPNAAKKYLANLGYTNAERHFGYDLDIIIAQLEKDCPVFMGAISGIAKGHAWVIDGYKTKTVKKTVCRNGMLLSETVVESTDYVHCNWGWAFGANNGWFVSGLFDVKDAYEYDNGYRIEDSYNYDKFFRMVTYDKPNCQ